MKKSIVTRTFGTKETFRGLGNMRLWRNLGTKHLNIRFIAGSRSEALSLLKSLDPESTRCLRLIRLGSLLFLILKTPRISFGDSRKKKDLIILVRFFFSKKKIRGKLITIYQTLLINTKINFYILLEPINFHAVFVFVAILEHYFSWIT